MPRAPRSPKPDAPDAPIGCASRAALFFIAVSVAVMGVVTVIIPSTGHFRRGGPVAEFLFKTQAGGAVLILIGCGLFVAALRRK